MKRLRPRSQAGDAGGAAARGQDARRPRLLVLGLNYAPERIGIAVYTTGLCEALAQRGFDVQVVTARPYYPDWRVFEGHRGWGARRTTENGIDVTRVPLYVPRSPTGLKRLFHHLSFALAAAPVLLRRALGRRPDMVVTIAPSLIAAPVAWLVARLVRARSWLHVQDFEVGAAFATGLMQPDGRAASLARSFERRVLTAFDLVSSISSEMCARSMRMGVDPARVFELRNWADTSHVLPLERPSQFRERWRITAPHVALYSGNIANKQGLDIVIEAARLLRDRSDLCFVICGDGPSRVTLEMLAAGLGNVIFQDLQPTEQLGELLGMATLHLLPQMAGAADLVLPSKLTNMLSSGRPVIATALAGTGLARELDSCGIVTPPGDARALADAIRALLDDPARAAELRRRARERAVAAWDKDRIVEPVAARLRTLLAPS